MLEFIFPKKDIETNELWLYFSSKNKKNFEVHDPICYKCHKKSNNFETHNYCKNKFELEKVVICFCYTNKIKKYILNFKYFHRKDLYTEIWELMNMFFEIYFWDLDKEKTTISYVPMHYFRKYFIKWYNQWELLAKFLSEKQKILLSEVCSKKRYTKVQAKIKTAEQRSKNIKDSFECLDIDKKIENIIIIDDILTSWSTIDEISKTIKEKYPKKKIYWLISARK